MASGNIVLPCVARPLDIGNGQTVKSTYSLVIDRESQFFIPDENQQYRRAWRLTGIREAIPGMKWCPDCGEWRPYSYFGADTRNRDKHRTYCRECENARNRRRYASRV